MNFTAALYYSDCNFFRIVINRINKITVLDIHMPSMSVKHHKPNLYFVLDAGFFYELLVAVN